jgi:2'-5' RNA ligase
VPERELFRDVIGILAKQFDAAKFEPHLTLCGADRKAPAKQLRKVRSGPVRLRIRGVAHSTKFTKTLYIRCTPNKSLKQLVAELGGDPSQLRDPHVSLVYKTMSVSVRRELAASIRLPFREINFDQVKIVSCTSPTETRKDVEGWRVIARKKL